MKIKATVTPRHTINPKITLRRINYYQIIVRCLRVKFKDVYSKIPSRNQCKTHCDWRPVKITGHIKKYNLWWREINWKDPEITMIKLIENINTVIALNLMLASSRCRNHRWFKWHALLIIPVMPWNNHTPVQNSCLQKGLFI